MEISFNVGSAQFTRIQNLGELIVGNNYLTKRRLDGLPSYDLIGRYTGIVDGNPHFDLMYRRARRYNDRDAYNEWAPYRRDPSERPDPSIVPVDEFIAVGEDGIGIFYLGENGELITPTTSPNMVTHNIVEARREALHNTGLPDVLKDEIGGFLGGKRSTSKKCRRNTSKKSRRTRKSRRTTSRRSTSRRTTSKKYRRSPSRSFK